MVIKHSELTGTQTSVEEQNIPQPPVKYQQKMSGSKASVISTDS